MTHLDKGGVSPLREALDLTLVVRRVIKATPERLFRAWTTPEHLTSWWGPAGIDCPVAEVDLQVGGGYRLANKMPDGSITWITGEFELIDPPRKLVYSWRLGEADSGPIRERVTVRFEPKGSGTEVIITHQHIAGQSARDQHQAGWLGCLDGLESWSARDHQREKAGP
jgi:uncharacterized protein YndB with AHSA1/START domain